MFSVSAERLKPTDVENVNFFHFSATLDVCCFTRCVKGAILSSLVRELSNVSLILLVGSMTSWYELFFRWSV